MNNIIKIDFSNNNRTCIKPESLLRVANGVIDATNRFKPVSVDPYLDGLRVRFNNAKPWVSRDSAYAAGLNDYCITLSLTFDVNAIPNQGKRYNPNKAYKAWVGSLVIDVNNYLYREFELAVNCPALDIKRASNGKKTIQFIYRMVKLNPELVQDLKDKKICSNY